MTIEEENKFFRGLLSHIRSFDILSADRAYLEELLEQNRERRITWERAHGVEPTPDEAMESAWAELERKYGPPKPHPLTMEILGR